MTTFWGQVRKMVLSFVSKETKSNSEDVAKTLFT